MRGITQLVGVVLSLIMLGSFAVSPNASAQGDTDPGIPPVLADESNVFSHYFFFEGDSLVDRYLVATSDGATEQRQSYHKSSETITEVNGKFCCSSTTFLAYEPDGSSNGIPENYRIIVGQSSSYGPVVMCLCFVTNNTDSGPRVFTGTGSRQYYWFAVAANISATRDPYLRDLAGYAVFVPKNQYTVDASFGTKKNLILAHDASTYPETLRPEDDNAHPDPFFMHPYNYRLAYRRSEVNPYKFVGRANVANNSSLRQSGSDVTALPEPLVYCSAKLCFGSDKDGARTTYMDVDYVYMGGLWYLRRNDNPLVYESQWSENRFDTMHQHLEKIWTNDTSYIHSIPVKGTVSISGVNWRDKGRLRVVALAGEPNNVSPPLEGQDNTDVIEWDDDSGTLQKLRLSTDFNQNVTIYACVRKGDNNYEGMVQKQVDAAMTTLDFGELKIEATPTKCRVDILEGTFTSDGNPLPDPDKLLNKGITDAILRALQSVGTLMQNFVIYIVQWVISLAETYVPI